MLLAARERFSPSPRVLKRPLFVRVFLVLAETLRLDIFKLLDILQKEMEVVMVLRVDIRITEKGSLSEESAHNELILVVYDTDYVKKLHAKSYRDRILYGAHGWYVPAKYALSFEERPRKYSRGGTDSGLFSALTASDDGLRDQAIWFSCLRDLPEVIMALKEKFPQEDFPDQVDYIIDFPFRRNDVPNTRASIVTPKPPKTRPLKRTF